MPQEAESARAREAIQAAYSDLALDYPWRYLARHDRIIVEAEYDTGTVDYVASTRTLTLTGGTWPDWARYGRILIGTDTVLYKMAERTSDTVATLETNFAPASDASSQTYTLYRGVYPLPGDFRSLIEVLDEQVWRTSYVEPDEWMRLERHVPRSGWPFLWTLMGAPDLFGSMALCFYGQVDTAQTFDFIYQRQPRRLKYDGYAYYSSQGTNTLSSAAKGATTAQFTGTSLQEDVVNAMLRTGMAGATGPPGGRGAAERYAEQKVITARGSTTEVTVGSAFEFGKATTHFAISDPVDLPEYLLEPFYRGCEYQMALRQTPRKTATAEKAYWSAIRKARQRDLMLPAPGSPLDGPAGWRDPHWTFLTGTITQEQ